MRSTRPVAPLLVLAVFALVGCSSDPDETTLDDDRTSATADLEGSIPTSGWWCRLIEEEIVEAATDGRGEEAREVLRQSDQDGWRCEVVLPVDGGPETETVLSLAVVSNAVEESEQWRTEATAADAAPGPDYLGESYVYPGTVVALVPCGAPVASPEAGTLVPYAVSLVAGPPAGQQLTDELVAPVRRAVVELDQGTGCAPSRAGTDDATSPTQG